MLIELLSSGGKSSDKSIAKALLPHDLTQIEYYQYRVNNMVGRVLQRHSIVTKDRNTKEYTLVGYNSLSNDEIKKLKQKCRQRLDDFIEKRGQQIYSHRKQSSGYISGSIKYEVLKRAKYRCELCGVSAEQKALEADHIIPRNHGGSDDISNLQALCYTCNAMKRDKDNTDFRQVRDSYNHRDSKCVFCNPDKERILLDGELTYVTQDKYPVTKGHILIIPKRHVSNYFELGQAEVNDCTKLLNHCQKEATSQEEGIEGFNIGVNVGATAGQTIMHCHIHLIPRRNGDTKYPIGGIRNIIPGKGDYISST
jgi:diadenosine tetraphosphate (Ap4A) HIT family hydrolase/5-methylcytosine-specific restriction endonuclease McrA